MRISELRLVSSTGDTLGRIVELVLDMQTGRVIQVLVSLDDCGIDDRLFPLPWCALRLDARRQCFILQLDESMTADSESPDIDYSDSQSELPYTLPAQQALH